VSGGLRWTEEQLAEFKARRGARNRPEAEKPCSDADEGPEWKLQGKIMRWCEEHGFPCFHDRSAGVNRAGFLDTVIALPGGRTLWVECKTRSGRLTKEQKREIMMLQTLGHEVYVVRSFRRFLELAARRGDQWREEDC
jgi:hypothetical protein